MICGKSQNEMKRKATVEEMPRRIRSYEPSAGLSNYTRGVEMEPEVNSVKPQDLVQTRGINERE